LQLQSLRQGQWQNAGKPIRTDQDGFFSAKRKAVGPYRFEAPGLGLSRVANPIP
jgi:hypothetical protein